MQEIYVAMLKSKENSHLKAVVKSKSKGCSRAEMCNFILQPIWRINYQHPSQSNLMHSPVFFFKYFFYIFLVFLLHLNFFFLLRLNTIISYTLCRTHIKKICLLLNSDNLFPFSCNNGELVNNTIWIQDWRWFTWHSNMDTGWFSN